MIFICSVKISQLQKKKGLESESMFIEDDVDSTEDEVPEDNQNKGTDEMQNDDVDTTTK